MVADFLNTEEEQTFNEIQFQISPDSQPPNSQSQRKLDQLKSLVNNISYQNKSNNFSINNMKSFGLTSPGYADVSYSNLNNSTNNSNVLMTSDYNQNSNISATIHQYDNHKVKLLNYVNKSKAP